MQQKVILVGSSNASEMISYFNNSKELLGLILVLQSFGYEVEGASKYGNWDISTGGGCREMPCSFTCFFFCKKATVYIGKSFELIVKNSYLSTS